MEKIAEKDFNAVLENISEEDKNILKIAYYQKKDCFFLDKDAIKDSKKKEAVLSILKPHLKTLSGNGSGAVDNDTAREDAKVLELQKEISNFQIKLNEYEELIKRKQAEFENYKKRTLKEKEQFKIIANQKLFLELFPIMDSIEKAIDIPKEKLGVNSLLEGIVLIEKQLKKVLQNNGVSPIESVNKEFDPNLHEAIQVEETKEGKLYEVDTVTKEWQRGYVANDKVLRHAKVVITKGNPIKKDANSFIPSTIKDNEFSDLLDKLSKKSSSLLEEAYEKGEGQYIVKDAFIGNKVKMKGLEKIFYKLRNI